MAVTSLLLSETVINKYSRTRITVLANDWVRSNVQSTKRLFLCPTRSMCIFYTISLFCLDKLIFAACHLIVLLQAQEESRKLCRDLSPQTLALVEAFNITDAMISAPIANDWISYNEKDNQGELFD